MALVAIDAGVFCRGREVADGVQERLGAGKLSDEELFDLAAERSGIESSRFKKLMYGPRSLLDGFRKDQVRLIAHLRAAAAETFGAESRVYLGRAGHLLPPSLTHVLKVCLAGTPESRKRQAMSEGFSNREAQRQIRADDEQRAEWTGVLFDRSPWDRDLYDIFLAMQEMSVDDAVEMVSNHALLPAVVVTPSVEQAMQDFRLAAAVGVTLAEAGADVDVICSDGRITILIKKHSIFLERYERELTETASTVPGVRSATARPGPQYREPGISFDIDIDVPSKILLVDDENEFVNALSERLQTRRMTPGSPTTVNRRWR